MGRDIGTGKVLTLVKSQPAQLSMFQTFFPEEDSDYYSNTIELYDALPKYFSNKQSMAALRQDGIFLKSLQRRCKHKGNWYDLIIKPARLVDKNGDEKEYYPSHQEELVEEALKKIACDRLNGVFLNDTAGVQFTLFELDKELRSQGHGMPWPDLITSLRICRNAGIEVIGPAGKVEVDSPIFPVLLLRNREEWRQNPKQVHCYVQFNPLITYSIQKLTYRQFDYAMFMQLKNHLARWFFKRLSHNYLQASLLELYTIKHSTIVQDSALVNHTRIRDQVRYVGAALKELQEDRKRVLLFYEKEVITGPKKKIEDVKYILTPHPGFIGQIKKANRRDDEITRTAFQVGVLTQEEADRRAHKILGEGRSKHTIVGHGSARRT